MGLSGNRTYLSNNAFLVFKIKRHVYYSCFGWSMLHRPDQFTLQLTWSYTSCPAKYSNKNKCHHSLLSPAAERIVKTTTRPAICVRLQPSLPEIKPGIYAQALTVFDDTDDSASQICLSGNFFPNIHNLRCELFCGQ
jgi:hypothetical protein